MIFRDCFSSIENIEKYIKEAKYYKDKYKDKIKINRFRSRLFGWIWRVYYKNAR